MVVKGGGKGGFSRNIPVSMTGEASSTEETGTEDITLEEKMRQWTHGDVPRKKGGMNGDRRYW